MHTMARVKNLHLADGDTPEPLGREIGEAQVVEAADRLVANTVDEAHELIELYAADPAKVVVAEPGVDLATFTPGPQRQARAALGLPADALVALFVGRIQPLKAPDVLIRAAAELVRGRPEVRSRLVVAVLGGASGAGARSPMGLPELAERLGIGDVVRFIPPVERATLAQWYRAADLVTVPSYSESFGLVALEALACGTGRRCPRGRPADRSRGWWCAGGGPRHLRVGDRHGASALYARTARSAIPQRCSPRIRLRVGADGGDFENGL
jgi:D-inositol-3-phosphate glycosyltransferase